MTAPAPRRRRASQRRGLIGLGVGSALAVALPASLLAQVIDTADGRDDPPAVVYLLVAVVLAAMGVGGWVVGRRRPARPAPLGATVGLAAIAVIQVLGVVRRLVAGDDVAWATIPLTVALAMAVGAGAAVLGARQPGRTRR